MRLQTNYFDDDDEEERFNLQQMERFAGGGREPVADPIHETLAMYEDQQPSPDYERAAPILEGTAPQQGGPSARELEDDAIRAVRDSYGQKDSMFEQGGPTAIAAGLDVLLNKGKDLGSIVGGYAQGRMRKDAEDRGSMRQMADFEIRRAQETAHDKERGEVNEINRGNLSARNAELEEARARRLARGNTDSDADNALKAAQTNNLESQAYERWTKDPNALDPETQARLTQQRELHGEDLADRKAAREQTNEFKRTVAENTAATKADQLARQQDKDYQAKSNKFRDETEKTRPQLQRMKQMDDIMNKPQYKDDIPGIGAGSYIPGWVPDALRGGTENATDARTMQSASADMADLLGRQRSGAAIPPLEYAKMQDFITAGKHATDQQFKDAYGAYHKVLSSEFMNQVSGREQNARDIMRADGGGMVDYMNMGEYEQPAPPPAAAPLPDGPGPRPFGPSDQRLGAGRGVGASPNNFGYADAPDASVLGTTPRGTTPRVDGYLRKLQQEDDDLGVGYR